MIRMSWAILLMGGIDLLGACAGDKLTGQALGHAASPHRSFSRSDSPDRSVGAVSTASTLPVGESVLIDAEPEATLCAPEEAKGLLRQAKLLEQLIPGAKGRSYSLPHLAGSAGHTAALYEKAQSLLERAGTHPKDLKEAREGATRCRQNEAALWEKYIESVETQALQAEATANGFLFRLVQAAQIYPKTPLAQPSTHDARARLLEMSRMCQEAGPLFEKAASFLEERALYENYRRSRQPAEEGEAEEIINAPSTSPSPGAKRVMALRQAVQHAHTTKVAGGPPAGVVQRPQADVARGSKKGDSKCGTQLPPVFLDTLGAAPQ